MKKVTLLVLMLTGVLASLVTPASASTTVDCTTDRSALQPAIHAAASGAVLHLTGTCVGTFTIDKSLTIVGGTLDAQQAGTTLTVTKGRVVLSHVEVTGAGSTAGAVNAIANSGHLLIERSLITGNHGSVFNTGTFKLFRSQIGDWGGLENQGEASVRFSTFSNSPVMNEVSGSLVVFGSRIDGNGGVTNAGFAVVSHSSVTRDWGFNDNGGITNFGVMHLLDSTVSENDADNGGSAGVLNGGMLHVAFSTIAWNGGDLEDGLITVPYNWLNPQLHGITRVRASYVDDCIGPVFSGGYNIVWWGDAGYPCNVHRQTTDMVRSQRQAFLDLGFYGGPTETMPPSGPGPAVDAIPVGATSSGGVPLCPASGATDQRFVPRPQGPGCDIGAAEMTP